MVLGDAGWRVSDAAHSEQAVAPIGGVGAGDDDSKITFPDTTKRTMSIARLLQPDSPPLNLGEVPPNGPVPPHAPTPGGDAPAAPEPPPIIIDPEKGVIAPVQLPTPQHPAQRATAHAGAQP